MPVIGILNNATLELQVTRLDAFRQGLKQIGFVEGQNVAVEYRSAEGQTDRLPELAAELVGRQITVLFANATAAALAAKAATATIPIVFQTGADPVEIGLVASLNRPGGNITGVAFLVNKLVPKRLELLRELVPGAATIGMLIDPTNPNAEADVKDAQAAAAAFGRKLFVVRAGTMADIYTAFASFGPTGDHRAVRCRRHELQHLARSDRIDGGAPGCGRELFGKRVCRGRRPDELRAAASTTCITKRASIPAEFSRGARPAHLSACNA